MGFQARRDLQYPLVQEFYLGGEFPSRGHLAMTKTFLIVILVGWGATGIWWTETRHTAERPAVYRVAPAALSRPECLSCRR